MWLGVVAGWAWAAVPWPASDSWSPLTLGGAAVVDPSGDHQGNAADSSDLLGNSTRAAMSWHADADTVFLQLRVAADAGALDNQDWAWLIDLDGVADDWELMVLVSGSDGDVELWSNGSGADGVFVTGLSRVAQVGDLASGEARSTTEGAVFTVEVQVPRGTLASAGWTDTAAARLVGATALTFVLQWEDLAGCDASVLPCDVLPDLLSDAVQIDGDGDGATDLAEAVAGTDIDDADSDDDGRLDGDELIDSDLDDVIDALECDTDDDGLPDGLEVGIPGAHADTDLSVGCFSADLDPSTVTDPAVADTDGGGLVDGLEDVNADGMIGTFETDPGAAMDDVDTDGDSIPDLFDLLFGAGDDSDSDGDGIDDGVEGLLDHDADGIPDFADHDSDGDGLLDTDEGAVDTDGDGLDDYVDTDSDDDRIPDEVEADLDGDGLLDDTDDDGVFDHLDTDSDDDTMPDSVEADGDGDGLLDDADGDGVFDVRDLDSDDDGAPDELEWDASGNLKPDDADDNGVFDYQQVDSDGDGVPDGVEADADGDGRLDDTDGDGIPDFQDLDSDDDGLDDADELPGDSDCDGLVDRVDADSEDGFCDTGLPVPRVDTGGPGSEAVPPQPDLNPFATPGDFTGGACSSTGVAPSVWLTVLGGLVGVLRRRRGLALGVAVLCPAVASAQAVNAQRFSPSVDGGWLTKVEDAQIGPLGSGGLGVLLHYADDPFVFRPVDGEPVAVLDAVATASLLGSLSLGRLRVGAELPVHLYTAGLDIDRPAHLGDLRLSSKAHAASVGPVDLGAYADVALPSGDREAFVGAGTAELHAGAIATASGPRWIASATAGVQTGTGSELGGLVVTPAVRAALGAGVAVTDALVVSTELDGEGWLGNGGAAGAVPIEWLVTGQQRVPGLGSLMLGGGSGLTPGLGAPRVRLVAGFQWDAGPGNERSKVAATAAVEMARTTEVSPPPERVLVAVHVVDPDGAAIPGASVRWVGLTGALSADGQGWVRVAVPAQSGDLRVTAPGFRDEALQLEPGAGGDLQRSVVLMPRTVTVDFEAGRIRCADGLFEPGEAVVGLRGHRTLDELAQLLTDTPSIARVVVWGHADDERPGPPADSVAATRVRGVVEHLVAHGIDAVRVTPSEMLGEAEADPVDVSFHIQQEESR